MNQDYVLTRLKESLQALASPAHIQRTLYPDFASTTDELVNEFADWLRTVRDEFPSAITAEQWQSLEMLEQHTVGRAAEVPGEVWEDAQLDRHQYWRIARVLAMEALRCFAWPAETPPTHFEEFQRWID